MATLVANAAATGFVSTYVRALARLFSLQCDVGSSVAGDSLLSAFQVFAQAGSRHTDYDVLAPFFWIEPSCIIPKGYLGTTAELGGAGSFGIMGEESTIPMFEEADEMGEPSDISTDWAFNFRSPRTCGYVLMYARHYRDGLAMLQLKSFDSHRISLSRREASELYNLKAQQGFVTIDQLMWVRGQSQLPHPAEACCIDGRVGATLWHGSCTDMYRRKAYPWLPEYREVAHAQVNICPGRLYFAGVGAACEDSCQAKRVRNRATQALEMAREWVTRTSAVMRPGVLVAESAPPRRRPAERVPLPAAEHRDNEDSGGMFMGTNITKAAPPVLGEGAVTTARPVPIARVHGSVIAPAPRPVGAPAAPGLGETGVGAGIAAQPSDYQSLPSAVSQQGSAAPSSGAAAAP